MFTQTYTGFIEICSCEVYTFNEPSNSVLTTSVYADTGIVSSSISLDVVMKGTTDDTVCGESASECQFEVTVSLMDGSPLPAWMTFAE